MPEQKPSSIPLHVHGSSKYYYDLGCQHPLCLKVASAAKAAYRARRREGAADAQTPPNSPKELLS